MSCFCGRARKVSTVPHKRAFHCSSFFTKNKKYGTRSSVLFMSSRLIYPCSMFSTVKTYLTATLHLLWSTDNPYLESLVPRPIFGRRKNGVVSTIYKKTSAVRYPNYSRTYISPVWPCTKSVELPPTYPLCRLCTNLIDHQHNEG